MSKSTIMSVEETSKVAKRKLKNDVDEQKHLKILFSYSYCGFNRLKFNFNHYSVTKYTGTVLNYIGDTRLVLNTNGIISTDENGQFKRFMFDSIKLPNVPRHA